jgi:tripartite-type tricarboxylate transporter receptor subunit TctC
MMVPARTSRDIVTKLHRNTQRALQTPDMQERMAKLGAEPMLMTPPEFDAYLKKEIAGNAALVKAAGIAVN